MGISVHQGSLFSQRFDWDCEDSEKLELLAKLCNDEDFRLLAVNQYGELAETLVVIKRES
jgi:hypothetical protein